MLIRNSVDAPPELNDITFNDITFNDIAFQRHAAVRKPSPLSLELRGMPEFVTSLARLSFARSSKAEVAASTLEKAINR